MTAAAAVPAATPGRPGRPGLPGLPSPPAPPAADGLQAVLFDMDGLLVASEHTWYDAETEVVDAIGSGDVAWGPEHQRALVGGPLLLSAQYLVDLTGATLTAEQVATLLVDAMERRLRTGPVQWMPGARELLAGLAAAGVPCALVSASYRRLVDAVLDAVLDSGVGSVGAGAFRTTVAGDEVARTKPHPDPYLLAAARLGADPAACVVLEDSPTGVAAGLAAGCVTVAVPSLVDIAPDPANPRLRVVRSLGELDAATLRAAVRRAGGAWR